MCVVCIPDSEGKDIGVDAGGAAQGEVMSHMPASV